MEPRRRRVAGQPSGHHSEGTSEDESHDRNERKPKPTRPSPGSSRCCCCFSLNCIKLGLLLLVIGCFAIVVFLPDAPEDPYEHFDPDDEYIVNLQVNRPVQTFSLDHLTSLKQGDVGKPDYAVRYQYESVGNDVPSSASPWHDISLEATREDDEDKVFHFICEIPKGRSEKMEIVKEEAFNPIRQDKHEDGSLRFFKAPLDFNYGALPQTWEDPHVYSARTGYVGDGDPIDVVELSNKPCSYVGEVKSVYVVGVLGLIDNDETDWKLLAIDVEDPKAKHYWDSRDIEKERIELIREFFRTYKMDEEGNGENEYAFDGKVQDKAYAHKVIEEAHVYWVRLQHHMESRPEWRELQE